MTILCSGGTHVYLTGQPRCTCGAAANGYPPVAMMFFPGYNPYTRPPKPDPAPDVSLDQLRAALRAGATHLSADGETAYDERKLGVWRCFWYEDQKRFGSWYKCDELAADAVKM